MIHGESDREGGISRMNGSRHVFAHFSSKHPSIQSSGVAQFPHVRGLQKKKIKNGKLNVERVIFDGGKLKRWHRCREIRRSALCHMKLSRVRVCG